MSSIFRQLVAVLLILASSLPIFANDELTTDAYDANGNTTQSNSLGYAYDFENRLIQAGAGVSIVYDGDGNRVSKTAGGVTTTYLVDVENPTGYAQVLQETYSGGRGTAYELSHTYVYGLERISERRYYLQSSPGTYANNYYVYDGHGSVRGLTNSMGIVTDTYDYDAFGILLHATGTTPNNYLFAGEQFDPDLGLYYNRARYLNTSTGRFWTMDTNEGDPESPFSLHKYLYASANPVTYFDPSGQDYDIASVTFTAGAIGGLAGATITQTPKGFFLGAAAAAGLGFICLDAELCTRAIITGAVNVVFQYAANVYDNYYANTLSLPAPNSQKQREALLAAFDGGAASVVIGSYLGLDPNQTGRLAAVQGGILAALTAAGQGKTLRQALVEGMEAALIAYLVDVAAQHEFGPQLHTEKDVEIIVEQVITGIHLSLATAINPTQEKIFKTLAPEAYHFIYGE